MRKVRRHTRGGLPPDVDELLKRTRPTEEVLRELEKEKVDFDKDPEFVADFLKAQFVDDIYRAMEEKGINKNQLAEILGKSRQYVGKILNETANFTIDTMAEISCALGRNLDIRMLADVQEAMEIEPLRPHGIVRGEIASSTGSFAGGKFNLPTVDMQDVVKAVEERKVRLGARRVAARVVSARIARESLNSKTRKLH
jgi:transcriptional regulator with XRE-family HTH domain